MECNQSKSPKSGKKKKHIEEKAFAEKRERKEASEEARERWVACGVETQKRY